MLSPREPLAHVQSVHGGAAGRDSGASGSRSKTADRARALDLEFGRGAVAMFSSARHACTWNVALSAWNGVRAFGLADVGKGWAGRRLLIVDRSGDRPQRGQIDLDLDRVSTPCMPARTPYTLLRPSTRPPQGDSVGGGLSRCGADLFQFKHPPNTGGLAAEASRQPTVVDRLGPAAAIYAPASPRLIDRAGID